MHAKEKVWWASNRWRKFQININYISSYSPGYGEFKMFVLTIAEGISVVDVSKIILV